MIPDRTVLRAAGFEEYPEAYVAWVVGAHGSGDDVDQKLAGHSVEHALATVGATEALLCEVLCRASCHGVPQFFVEFEVASTFDARLIMVTEYLNQLPVGAYGVVFVDDVAEVQRVVAALVERDVSTAAYDPSGGVPSGGVRALVVEAQDAPSLHVPRLALVINLAMPTTALLYGQCVGASRRGRSVTSRHGPALVVSLLQSNFDELDTVLCRDVERLCDTRMQRSYGFRTELERWTSSGAVVEPAWPLHCDGESEVRAAWQCEEPGGTWTALARDEAATLEEAFAVGRAGVEALPVGEETYLVRFTSAGATLTCARTGTMRRALRPSGLHERGCSGESWRPVLPVMQPSHVAINFAGRMGSNCAMVREAAAAAEPEPEPEGLAEFSCDDDPSAAYLDYA